jgi:hypothetical protein
MIGAKPALMHPQFGCILKASFTWRSSGSMVRSHSVQGKGVYCSSNTGQYLGMHQSGYTDFTLRLDNASSLLCSPSGPSNANVIAIRADASFGSGASLVFEL